MKLDQQPVQFIWIKKLRIISGKYAQANAIAPTLAMQDDVFEDPAKTRCGKAIELKHGNGFGHTPPGIFQCFGRKTGMTAKSETAFVRTVQAESQHPVDAGVTGNPLLNGRAHPGAT